MKDWQKQYELRLAKLEKGLKATNKQLSEIHDTHLKTKDKDKNG